MTRDGGDRSAAEPVRITSVEVITVTGAHPESRYDFVDITKFRQVTASSVYNGPSSTVRRPRFTIGSSHSARYLRLGTDAGVEGLYGPLDHEVEWPILHQLGPALIGLDALAGTIIWDFLERRDPNARHGHFKLALSAIDNALWDIRGKVLDLPVWRLLGGASRDRIPAYLSTLGASLDADVVREVARFGVDGGFSGQKWFFADGPADGPAGLAANVALARTVRESIGPDIDMMFDAFLGWDVPYTIAWSQRVAELLPAWLEEPVSPARYPAFEALSRTISVPLAAGEHLLDREETLRYLQGGVLGYLQSDPEWCGGITELARMCSIADVFGVPVIPHGHGIRAALHAVASQPPMLCPKIEYLAFTAHYKLHFEADPPVPEGGSFALPTEAGFGIRFDDSKIDARKVAKV